jgi:DNA-binding NarL/FixJ family response regulator
MPIRVVVADDQPLMRAALRDCLAAEPDITVVAEAADGATAVTLVRQHTPDVALLDIRMPVLDGVEATRRITADPATATTRVLIVTTFDLDDYIVAALRAGASGFLVKDATPAELVHAVHVIAAGDALLAPTVTRRLLDQFLRFMPPPQSAGAPYLTQREQAVLQLLARGATNAQIANELYLAESSVKTHVGHLLAKLSAPDRVHLVLRAYELGLVPHSSLSMPYVAPERSI